jgi:hypothetical protein
MDLESKTRQANISLFLMHIAQSATDFAAYALSQAHNA